MEHGVVGNYISGCEPFTVYGSVFTALSKVPVALNTMVEYFSHISHNVLLIFNNWSNARLGEVTNTNTGSIVPQANTFVIISICI